MTQDTDRQNRFLFATILSLFCFLIGSCNSQKEEDPNPAILVAALANRNPQTSSATTTTTAPQTTTFSCSNSAPAFSTLRDAGFDSSCGRSGCHDGTTRYNTRNVNEVKTYVTVRQPNASSLFTFQNGGIMASYSNTALSQAIYCWILGGANN